MMPVLLSVSTTTTKITQKHDPRIACQARRKVQACDGTYMAAMVMSWFLWKLGEIQKVRLNMLLCNPNIVQCNWDKPEWAHTSNNCYVINRTQNTTTMIRLFMHATRIQWCRLQHILIWFMLLSTIVNGVNCSATINGWC